MATISNAMVSMTINSSYVLISLILSARLGTDNEPPVGCLGSILYCHGSLRGSPLRHIAVAVGNPDTFLGSYAFKGSSMRGQAGYWDWLPNLGESVLKGQMWLIVTPDSVAAHFRRKPMMLIFET